MTLLHAAPRADVEVVELDSGHRGALQDLLDADPYTHAVISARLRSVGTLAPRRLGGTMFGVLRHGRLTAACFSGGNLLPIGGDVDDWRRLAEHVAVRPRVCTSVVGPADAVAQLWQVAERAWGPARSVRADQPLLVTDTQPTVLHDPAVTVVGPHRMDRYVAAAAAMFSEELGISPHVSPGTGLFRSRIAELIDTRRAIARVDARGQVVFKAEIGAVTEHTAQVQGVWVRPDLRRRGIGTPAMASVIRYGLTLAPTVSLYVNDFNEPARRMYDRLGMRQVGTLSTVLL